MNDLQAKEFTRRDFLANTAKLCLGVALSSILPSCRTPEPVTDEPTPEVEEPVALVPEFEPAYLELHRTGELEERAEELWAIMGSCQLCPRRCGADRLGGVSGFCRAPGTGLIVSGAHAHFGEERPLVGGGGSGTIFLSHCGLRCVFCQNYTISHLGRGSERSIEELAEMMLRLQRGGCHNINVVTPTHYSPHILKALDVAAGKGLHLPVVYNTSGWERMEVLQQLDGIVDIYLPDFKYWDSEMAAKYSAGAESYPELTREAMLEMNRQVGVAKPAKDGIMQRGLMIRHLVMPNDVGGSVRLVQWIAEELPQDTYVNIMAQYTPAHRAYDYPEISRRINAEEYREVVDGARSVGLTNLDVQAYWWLED